MSNRLLILGIVFAGSAATLLAAESTRPMKTVRDKTVRMLLSDFKTQEKAKKQILEERKKTISELTAIVADPENHVYRSESVRKAMSCLGELRALEGIEVLVTYIGFPWVHHPDAGEYPGPAVGGRNSPGHPIERLLPAIPALINIGEPCIDAVIRKLCTTDNVLEHKACVAVLKNLEQHPSVREKLERAIKQGKARKPEVLRKALKMLGEEAISGEK